MKKKKKEEVLKGRDDVKSILLVRVEAEVKLKELVELLEESENKNNENDDKKKKESNKFDLILLLKLIMKLLNLN